MIELSDLFVLFFIALFCAYWYSASGIKQFAFVAAKNYCSQMDLQFLDESVALRAIWFKRGEDGQMHIWRSYIFEFTANGEDRYQGKIVLLGKRVTNIDIPVHRVD